MEILPDDVLTNILIRLPAKPLAKARSVSKLWNHLLCQPHFLKSHQHRSIYINDEILLVFYNEFYSDKPFTAHSCQSPNLFLTNLILPNKASSLKGLCSIIGSVNGLICFSNSPSNSIDASSKINSKNLYICNPSLSTLSRLPPYASPKYAFSVWGYWDLIRGKFPSKVTKICNQDELCVYGHDGHMHWLGYLYEEQKLQTIVSLDLAAKTLSEITLPDSLQDDSNVHRQKVLGVYKGKLCLMSCIRDGECEMWVLNEYGVADSWVKQQHVLSHFSSPITPFGFTLNNKFLFENYNERLALYDPVEDKVKPFNVKARERYKTKIVHFVESLVWIAPAKSEFEEDEYRHDVLDIAVVRGFLVGCICGFYLCTKLFALYFTSGCVAWFGFVLLECRLWPTRFHLSTRIKNGAYSLSLRNQVFPMQNFIPTAYAVF
ncbi:F-box domain-containing protein [Artemisia annua]|uniref:F-box domain-containing protein n=1 Tax=Artemisia annua TaxID=35608 RepID=A0A2U1NJP0_ARTAN|nr:F-box domain-containing protein [Artemisia annua]